MFHFLSSKKNGFTLIEMLIVVLLFSILLGTMLGVWLAAIRLQRYSLATQRLLDQTSYAMEYMSRSIRMAKKDLDGSCLTSVGRNYDYHNVSGYLSGLVFKNYDLVKCKGLYLFFQDVAMPGYTVYQNRLYDYERGRAPRDFLPLTSDDLKVNDFNINLEGQDGLPPTDKVQPRVTIFLDIEHEKLTHKPKIKIQTTISQRDLDVAE